MALDETTIVQRRRAATLEAEFKPFYKRRSFWLPLLLGLALGAGCAVAIPFVAPALVMGLVTALIALTSPVAGWAIVAIVGAAVGLALMAGTYALVRGIGSKIKQSRPEQQRKEVEKEFEVTRYVEGSEAANKIAAKIAQCMEQDTAEARKQESELRQKALTMPCFNAEQKVGIYYAALGIKCVVGERKEVKKTDYYQVYHRLGLHWHNDINPAVANAEEEFKTINIIVEKLKNIIENNEGLTAEAWEAHEQVKRQDALYREQHATFERERKAQNEETAEQLTRQDENIKEITATQKRQDARIKENDARITEHDARITEHDARITEHDGRIQEIDEKLNSQLTALGEIQHEAEENALRFQDLEKRTQKILDRLGMSPQSGLLDPAPSTSATLSKVIHRGPVVGNSENNAADIVVEKEVTERRSSSFRSNRSN